MERGDLDQKIQSHLCAVLIPTPEILSDSVKQIGRSRESPSEEKKRSVTRCNSMLLELSA